MSSKFKLNFDGSADSNPSLSGVGGIICDREASIILSFSDPLVFAIQEGRNVRSENWPIQNPADFGGR